MPDIHLLGPIPAPAIHLCIDMQNIFAPGGPWSTPWMPKVLPLVEELVGRYPERTVFTRFITPHTPDDMPGMWQRYYHRWQGVTREHIDWKLLDIVPTLVRFAPPA